MQIFRSLSALAARVTEQQAQQAEAQELALAQEPQDLDEALLAQISGGRTAPGNGW